MDECKSEMKSDEYEPNPEELNGVPDLSALIHLKMENILHNIEYRYCKMKTKQPYTSVSTILLSINPYEELPIYGDDTVNEVHEEQKQFRLPIGKPHPYVVASRSYMRMIQRKCNQSIVICGQSCTGKTYTAHLVSKYLVMTAAQVSMDTTVLKRQIMASYPILEAFGNAATNLNRTASRFGRFTKLLYDVAEKAKSGDMFGAYLETYLLESNRVIYQVENERNYNIAYFLYAGIPQCDHNEFGLQNPSKWHYTNQGHLYEVPGLDDAKEFIKLKEALTLMRIDEILQKQIWRILGGLYNLGNVRFGARWRAEFRWASVYNSNNYIDIVSKLWNIDRERLLERLTSKTLKCMRRVIVKKIVFEDAVMNRDVIAKTLYERLFLYLVSRCNAELFDFVVELSDSTLFIGVLDMFGFANCIVNSLEQFCINFANEKLQQFFNYHIIRSKQEKYIKENSFWKPITVMDNLDYINMVEEKRLGFFSVLDSSCKYAVLSTDFFLMELFKIHGKNRKIKRTDKQMSGSIGKRMNKRNELLINGYLRQFEGKQKYMPSEIKQLIFDLTLKMVSGLFVGIEITHFADVVSYDVSQFLDKNMVSMHHDTQKMLKNSGCDVLKQLPNFGRKRGKKFSVTKMFHKGIRTLMKNLQATEPYFIQCIKPNDCQSPTVWNKELIKQQLESNGLAQALKVLKLGYPTRVPYNTLYDRYHSNHNNPLLSYMDPQSFCQTLLIGFDVNENDYELGLTKIFFKPSKAVVLDRIMNEADKPLSQLQNDKITKYVVQKRIIQLIGVCKGFLQIRRRVRLKRAAVRLEYVGRVASICAWSVCKHLEMVRFNKFVMDNKETLICGFIRIYCDKKQLNADIVSIIIPFLHVFFDYV